MTQKQLLETVLIELTSIKNHMPNGELKQMQKDMENLKDNVSDLKHVLLNPDNGVIVNTNKNTDFRHIMQSGDKDFQLKLVELQELKRWKEGVTKALWILFAGLAGVIIKLFSEAIKNG
jgi:hypothetical protein